MKRVTYSLRQFALLHVSSTSSNTWASPRVPVSFPRPGSRGVGAHPPGFERRRATTRGPLPAQRAKETLASPAYLQGRTMAAQLSPFHKHTGTSASEVTRPALARGAARPLRHRSRAGAGEAGAPAAAGSARRGRGFREPRARPPAPRTAPPAEQRPLPQPDRDLARARLGPHRPAFPSDPSQSPRHARAAFPGHPEPRKASKRKRRAQLPQLLNGAVCKTPPNLIFL